MMETLPQVSPLDWLGIAVVFISFLIGAWRGLVYEVMAVLGWIAAFIVAQMFASQVGDMLPISAPNESVRYAAGYATVFIATLIAASGLTWFASKAIQNIGLRPVDRILGAGFGVARGLLLLMALVIVVQMTPLKNGPWWTQSQGYVALDALLKKLKPVLPPDLGKYISWHRPFSAQQGLPTCVES
jgi:membrane protein required for colicin V production